MRPTFATAILLPGPWPPCSHSFRQHAPEPDSPALLGFGFWDFGFGSCATFAELRGVGIGRRARPEDPSDDDPDQQDARNVDEVRGGRHQARERFATSDSSRSTSCCTLVRRRPTDTRYPNSTTQTNAYAV